MAAAIGESLGNVLNRAILRQLLPSPKHDYFSVIGHHINVKNQGSDQAPFELDQVLRSV